MLEVQPSGGIPMKVFVAKREVPEYLKLTLALLHGGDPNFTAEAVGELDSDPDALAEFLEQRGSKSGWVYVDGTTFFEPIRRAIRRGCLFRFFQLADPLALDEEGEVRYIYEADSFVPESGYRLIWQSASVASWSESAVFRLEAHH